MIKNLDHELEKSLIVKSANVRLETVKRIHKAGAGHTGGDMSAADILIALYTYMNVNPENINSKTRDYFILSKGHSAEILYEVLAEFGFFEKKRLDSLGKLGSEFGGHPTKNIPGVEANTGSLGHGLGIGVGIALGLKRDKMKNQVFVLTGDGELAEGSNWEAAMAANKYKLNNLTLIVDRNYLQISGKSEDVMPLEPLDKKMESFGFKVLKINGHSYKEIFEALNSSFDGKPKAIIAETIKGYGIRDGEGIASWHHRVPNKEQVTQMEIDMKRIVEEINNV